MKSSFLVSIVLSALVSVPALAQTNRPRRVQQKPSVTKPAAPAASTQTTSQAVSATAAAEKSSFDKFYERLSIGYFGVFTSPTLEDWDTRNAAISPEYGDTGKHCRKNCDTYAMNLWSQINFAYDFGWLMKFVVIPRWTTYFDNPRDMGAPEDQGTFGLEDFLVGFAGSIITSEDKKFNWFIRPGMRLPTSRFSRDYDHPAFGQITHQLEVAHFITYDFNPQWQLGLQLQQRFWIFENRYNYSRARFLTSPYVSYAVADTTKLQVYYNHFLENNKRWKSVNGKDPVFKDVWQELQIGVAQDITKTVNVMPYLGLFVNDVPFSSRSAYLGAWISWKIK